MRGREPRGLLDRGHARARPTIGDVRGERTVKQDRIQLHNRNLAAQRLLRCFSDVLAVDEDPPTGNIVERLHQLDEGFAGAVPTKPRRSPERMSTDRPLYSGARWPP